MNFLAKRITLLFVKRNIIKEEEKRIYEYSFEIIISTLVNALLLVILAIITKMYFETLSFAVVFIILRRFVGGYHAKTHFKCSATLIITYYVMIASLVYLPTNVLSSLSLILIVPSMLLILGFAPIDHPNNPIEEEKKRKMRNKGIFSFSLVSIIVIILSYFGKIDIAFSLSYCTFAISLFVLLGFYCYKKNAS